MIDKTIEIDGDVCVSAAEKLGPMLRDKLVDSLHDRIVDSFGAGPWPKLLGGGLMSETARARAASELQLDWPTKQRVFVELHIRSTRLSEIRTEPLRRALELAGWAVCSTPDWLYMVVRGHVIGDPKLVLRLVVPESWDERVELDRRANRFLPL